MIQIWRGLLDIYRNPSLLLTTNAVALLLGVLCGLIFWDLSNDIAGAQNRAGCIFFSTVLMGLFALVACDSMTAEKDVVRKEVGLGWYSPLLYVGSRALLDACLLRILPAVLYAAPLYFMAGFQETGDRFLLFLLTLCTFAVCTGLIALIIVQWTSRVGITMLVTVFVLILSLLFSGFLVNHDSMNASVRWLSYLSVVKYAHEALLINEFQGTTYLFAVEGYTSYDGIKGEVFAQSIGIDVDDLTQNLWALAVWFGALVILLMTSAVVNYRRIRH